MPILEFRRAVLGLLALASAGPLSAQTLRVQQAVPLRSERSAEAPQLANLAAGQGVTLLQMSGGWVRVQAGGAQGWLRASQLEMPGADVAAVSQRETGRRQDGATAVTLGVRGAPSKRDRHALIVGIGNVQVTATRPLSALSGVRHDMVSALAMAGAWRVPPEQTTLLRDSDATREGVRQALREIEGRVQNGDRVYVYWAGYGSRQVDAGTGGCVETVVPYDLHDIAPRDWAQWLRPMASQAVTVIFVQDTGGSATAGRSGGGPGLASRFASGASACADAGKLGPHSLAAALQEAGYATANFVHVMSSRPAELSPEDPVSGGVATAALARCLLAESAASPAFSVTAWVGCAQSRIDAQRRALPSTWAQQLVLDGNRDGVSTR